MILQPPIHYTFNTMDKATTDGDGRFKEGKDLDALIRTVFGESRGELEKGIIAVAHVVRNRACIAWDKIHNGNGKKHPLFGDGSLYSACHVAWQFSCWNKNDDNNFKVNALSDTGPIYKQLKLIVLNALNSTDITGGATHYHEQHLLPAWTKGAIETCRIGHHVFYKGVK